MKLIEYDRRYRQDFIDFNTAWIEDNFGHLEPEDYETFEHIEDEIKDGAMIYFAIDEDGTALATCMAKPMEGSTWELRSMLLATMRKKALKWYQSHLWRMVFLMSRWRNKLIRGFK